MREQQKLIDLQGEQYIRHLLPKLLAEEAKEDQRMVMAVRQTPEGRRRHRAFHVWCWRKKVSRS
jgi:hypothetical protein